MPEGSTTLQRYDKVTDLSEHDQFKVTWVEVVCVCVCGKLWQMKKLLKGGYNPLRGLLDHTGDDGIHPVSS